jgi:adenylosuccinate synthase
MCSVQTLKICTGFLTELDGEMLDYCPPLPTGRRALRCRFMRNARMGRPRPKARADLPTEAIKYVRRVEELISARRPINTRSLCALCRLRFPHGAKPTVHKRWAAGLSYWWGYRCILG